MYQVKKIFILQNYYITLFSISLLFCNTLYSQKNKIVKIDELKSNSAYIWGEGEAEEKIVAQQIAENDLLSKIQVSINVATFSEQKERETQEGITFVDDFQKKHRSYTGLYLKGLERIAIEKKKIWYVFTYIHKDLLKESFDLRKEKIKSFALSGQISSEKGQIGEALRNYYWGYLLALSYPDTINLSPNITGLPSNPQVAITTSLNSLLEKIEINAGLCYKRGNLTIAPLNFKYQNELIKNLSFSYYSGVGTDYGIVENGYVEIPLYDKPTNRTRKLTLKIEYTYESEMSTDQELTDLYEIFNENKFNTLKSVDISFPWIEETASKKEINKQIEVSTEAIDVLRERNEINEFFDVLAQFKKLGVINFGRRNDFGNGKNCFVAVADDKQILEILYYNGNSFISLNSSENYMNLSERYRGKRQIWIKEVKY